MDFRALLHRALLGTTNPKGARDEVARADPAGRGHDTADAQAQMRGEANLTSSTIEEWVRERQHEWAQRPAVETNIATRLRLFGPEHIGLSGLAIEQLFAGAPAMAPTRVWGGDLGWRSKKRLKSWQQKLEKQGVPCGQADQGCLVRAAVALDEWAPHPYAPPSWSLMDEKGFASYYGTLPGIFELAREWHRENRTALVTELTRRLDGLPVAVGGSYTFAKGDACIDFALWTSRKDDRLFSVSGAWKGQAALVALVRAVFPDALSEFNDGWLGQQRLDVFVPSRSIAIEYQGQQHYEAVEFFGGEDGLRNAQKRDRAKRKACKQAGVTLIEWHHRLPVTPGALRSMLASIGVRNVDFPEYLTAPIGDDD